MDGGGRDGGSLLPVTLYDSVDLTDEALADQVILLLRGTSSTPRCHTCHGIEPATVRNWGALTDAAMACIEGLDPNVAEDAGRILSCFEEDRMARPQLLGLLSTAVGMRYFTRSFDVYYEDLAASQQIRFVQSGRMPKYPGVAYTQEDFDLLMTWWERGFPLLEERLEIVGGLDCIPSIGPEVGAHVSAMATEGWATLNRDRGIAMHGCGPGENGAACLSGYPLSTTRAYADGWVVEDNLRILFEYTYRSSYWHRSSPDGRFVSHGGSPETGAGRAGAAVVDLRRSFVIPAEASYDPGFFPDNTGFVLQGTSSGAGVCRESLLFSEPSRITFSEPECEGFRGIGLYQHLGAVNGGDYWTVFGQFVSDNGGHSPRTDALAVPFDADTRVNFVPLVYDGSSYRALERVQVDSPFEGDTVISPSGRLYISRARGDDGTQAGFVLHALNATPSGGTYTVTTPEIGRYCGRGAKPGFSYDERYITYHRYVIDADATELGFVDAGDPGFAGYRTQGAANVYVTDLTTGATRRITNMRPGQYALFPHFRSDGWIYFNVRDTVRSGSTNEYLVASDAVLVP